MTRLLFYVGTILMCSAGVAPTVMAQDDDFEITLEVLDDVSEIEGVILSLEDALEIDGSGNDTADSETAADRAFDEEVESAEEDDDEFEDQFEDELEDELEDENEDLEDQNDELDLDDEIDSELEEDLETELDE